MEFYYSQFPKIPVGRIERLEDDLLTCEPYRSLAHLQLIEDLKLGKECECFLKDGRKILVVSQTDDYKKLKIRISN